MFEPEDLTPIFIDEPLDVWRKALQEEYEIVDKFIQDGFGHILGFCYIKHPTQSSRCVRGEGHLGPHWNPGYLWDPVPEEKRWLRTY